MDKLDTWFEEAKHSLSIAEPICMSANQLVDDAHNTVEHAVLIWAKIHFMKRALDHQIMVLDSIDRDLSSLKNEVSNEIERICGKIKIVDQSLANTLSRLENTVVDEGFSKQKAASGTQSKSKLQAVKTLRTFVHEEGIEDVKSALKQAISRSRSATSDISSVIEDVRANIAGLRSQQTELIRIISNEADRKKLEQVHKISVKGARDAHSMAQLLENLTSHYDLCQEAINLRQGENPQKEDLAEIVGVLSHDSRQVETAIEELYTKKAALEQGRQEIGAFANLMDSSFAKVKEVWLVVDQFGATKLTVHAELVESISTTAVSSVQEAQTLNLELESLVEYYTLFYTAYNSLILETIRRSNSQNKLESTVKDMQAQLQKMRTEEEAKRAQFIRQHGTYLPADLWSHLEDAPPKCTIKFTPQTLPKLEQASIDRAAKQVSI